MFEEEIILLKPESERFRNWIKIRWYPNGSSYYSYYNRKIEKKEEERIELIRQINLNNFDAYYTHRDTTKKPINKKIVVFLHNKTNYMIETFSKGGRRMSIIRVSKYDKDTNELRLPEFLKI